MDLAMYLEVGMFFLDEHYRNRWCTWIDLHAEGCTFNDVLDFLFHGSSRDIHSNGRGIPCSNPNSCLPC